jgi:pimeloyl-ACP methyl ester carboxylesterase
MVRASIFFPVYAGSVALLSVLPYVYAQNSSSPFPNSSTCDERCQQLSVRAITFEESAHAHTPLDAFYSIPDSFNTSMKPGTLLRVEAHTNLVNYTVPSGLTMSRIMYTSLSLNGTVVPVSAYVLWPYAPFEYTSKCNSQRSGKFPLVAWAHGTSGQFQNCSPSNYRSLQYHFMVPYTIALEGFVVIAPDYAGLGVTTRPNGEASHEWLAGPAGANDVAYAVEAVRMAFPEQLLEDGPFVTLGHSQGGNIAWAFAERQAESPVPGYRGTISISPPTRAIDWVNLSLKTIATTPADQLPQWAQLVFALQPKIIAAITTVYPSYNYSGMTAASYDRWNNVVKPLQGCLPTESLAFATVLPADVAKPNWTSDSVVQEWKERVAVGGKEFAGPMLLIAGDNDALPISMIGEDVDRTCQVNKNQSLELIVYEATEHFSVIQASRVKWVGWIKERISGGSSKDASGGDSVCGKSSFVNGFNTNYTIHSVAPNWIVDWAPSPAEMWKYTL